MSENATTEAATLTDNAARRRYEMPVDGHVAFIDYVDQGGTRVLTHTEVPRELGGRGVGTRLARAAFDSARAAGLKLDLRCSFLVDFVARNPAYRDLLA